MWEASSSVLVTGSPAGNKKVCCNSIASFFGVTTLPWAASGRLCNTAEHGVGQRCAPLCMPVPAQHTTGSWYFGEELYLSPFPPGPRSSPGWGAVLWDRLSPAVTSMARGETFLRAGLLPPPGPRRAVWRGHCVVGDAGSSQPGEGLGPSPAKARCVVPTARGLPGKRGDRHWRLSVVARTRALSHR